MDENWRVLIEALVSFGAAFGGAALRIASLESKVTDLDKRLARIETPLLRLGLMGRRGEDGDDG
jgi:hypothetical protein